MAGVLDPPRQSRQAVGSRPEHEAAGSCRVDAHESARHLDLRDDGRVVVATVTAYPLLFTAITIRADATAAIEPGAAIGFDAGANLSKVFILVYHLPKTGAIFQRFHAVASAHDSGDPRIGAQRLLDEVSVRVVVLFKVGDDASRQNRRRRWRVARF